MPMAMIHCDKCGKDMRVHQGDLPRGWAYRVYKSKGKRGFITVCPECSRKEKNCEEEQRD